MQAAASWAEWRRARRSMARAAVCHARGGRRRARTQMRAAHASGRHGRHTDLRRATPSTTGTEFYGAQAVARADADTGCSARGRHDGHGGLRRARRSAARGGGHGGQRRTLRGGVARGHGCGASGGARRAACSHTPPCMYTARGANFFSVRTITAGSKSASDTPPSPSS